MNKKIVWVAVGSVVVLTALYFLFAYNPNERTLAGGLKVEDLMVGTGAEAVKGATVSVHYAGWLTDGNQFDSSLDRGTPFSFPLGAGMVIKGWDEGVVSMKVGGKRKLTIPPELAYGDRDVGNGLIPPRTPRLFSKWNFWP